MVRFRFLYRQYTNFLYFNLYLNTAHAAHYVYFNILMRKSLIRFHGNFLAFQIIITKCFPAVQNVHTVAAIL